MPEAVEDRLLDIKERIEAQVVADLVDGLQIDAVNVQRQEEGENAAVIPSSGASDGVPPEAWVVVTTSDEDGIHPGQDFAGSEGVVGGETLIMPATIDVHLGVRPDGVAFKTWCNYWIAKAKQAVMGNVNSLEDGGDPTTWLAVNTRVVGTFGPTRSDDNRETIVGIEIEKHYRHAEGDPYTRY